MAKTRPQRLTARMDAPIVAMAKGLSRYKPEEEKIVRKVEVKEDETLRQIKKTWKEFRYDSGTRRGSYENALKLVEPLAYHASNVGNFSVALAEFQNEKYFSDKAGVFLSALINNGKDTNYVIDTGHLELPIDYLGYKNTKNITVGGNIGRNCGFYMEAGTITVNGDAGFDCGAQMKDGSIIVKGDAGETCGAFMKSGSIAVNGNAGERCGWSMEGGLITVEGDASRFCGMDMKGGTITVKGNAGDRCGLGMKGGTITVNGDAGWNCGEKMKGGKIIMKSNAGKKCGLEMEGGEIHVHGEIGSISENIQHGKIYHKGKLIVNK